MQEKIFPIRLTTARLVLTSWGGSGRMRGGCGEDAGRIGEDAGRIGEDEIQVMQEAPESEECNPGSSWNFAKQSWNPPEFGTAMHVMPSNKQYNPGKVRNFPRDFQATVQNKSGAKFSRAKNPWCENFPLPVGTPCRGPLQVKTHCVASTGGISVRGQTPPPPDPQAYANGAWGGAFVSRAQWCL